MTSIDRRLAALEMRLVSHSGSAIVVMRDGECNRKTQRVAWDCLALQE